MFGSRSPLVGGGVQLESGIFPHSYKRPRSKNSMFVDEIDEENREPTSHGGLCEEDAFIMRSPSSQNSNTSPYALVKRSRHHRFGEGTKDSASSSLLNDEHEHNSGSIGGYLDFGGGADARERERERVRERERERERERDRGEGKGNNHKGDIVDYHTMSTQRREEGSEGEGRGDGRKRIHLTSLLESEMEPSNQRCRSEDDVRGGEHGCHNTSLEDVQGEFSTISPELSSAYLADHDVTAESAESIHECKRSRMHSDEDKTKNSLFDFGNQRGGMGMGMGGGSMFPTFGASADFTLIAALRADYDERMKQKVKELEKMAGIIAVLQREHMDQANNNTILKKAVAIQENRQRELMEQNRALTEENHKLQCVLQNAAAHIGMLERENAQLKMQLGCGSHSPTKNFGNFMPPPPPDVF